MTTTTKPAKLPPTPDPRCGTHAGYKAHRKRGESACPGCLQANRDASRLRRATPEGREAHRRAGLEAARRILATPEGREANRLASREAARRRLATHAGREANREKVQAIRDRWRTRTAEEADADFARLRPDGKACRGCGELLPAEAFTRNLSMADGRNAYCDHNGCRYRTRKLRRDHKLHAYWASREIQPTECLYCGGPAQELEHVFPKALGGTDDFSNLAPVCIPCNHGPGGKHNTHPVTWLRTAHPDRLEAIIALFPHIVENS